MTLPNATHVLKTVDPFFNELWNGTKKFEVRLNDRHFVVGDFLELRHYDPYKNEFTGRVVFATVDYILHGGQFGIEKGYVVMSLTDMENKLIKPTTP